MSKKTFLKANYALHNFATQPYKIVPFMYS